VSGDEEIHVEIPLKGGRANAGSVVRIGAQVARPAHPQTPNVSHYLDHLHRQGIGFVPQPLGLDEQGRQRLSWIEGVAPTSPYARWVFEERLLIGVAEHQQRLHAASATYEPPATGPWATNAGDYFPDSAVHQPHASLFCHNDLCMSNLIVDPDTITVQGIIDFDYVRLVDPLFDIAVMARHWVPFRDPAANASPQLDLVQRYRLIAELHDLSQAQSERVIALAVTFLTKARTNVRALADAGGVGFQALIDDGYEAANQRTVDWLINNSSSMCRPT